MLAASSEPTYSPDVLDAAQAQVLQEQDLAMQQALAAHRFAFCRLNTIMCAGCNHTACVSNIRLCPGTAAQGNVPWSCSGHASTEDGAAAEAPQEPAVLKVNCLLYCQPHVARKHCMLHNHRSFTLTGAHVPIPHIICSTVHGFMIAGQTDEDGS